LYAEVRQKWIDWVYEWNVQKRHDVVKLILGEMLAAFNDLARSSTNLERATALESCAALARHFSALGFTEKEIYQNVLKLGLQVGRELEEARAPSIDHRILLANLYAVTIYLDKDETNYLWRIAWATLILEQGASAKQADVQQALIWLAEVEVAHLPNVKNDLRLIKQLRTELEKLLPKK
jgi:hypothetical protein